LVINPQAGGQVVAPVDLQIATTTTASGSLKGAVFAGSFAAAMEIVPLLPRTMLKGEFEATLS